VEKRYGGGERWMMQKARKVAAKMAGGVGASVRTWLLTE